MSTEELLKPRYKVIAGYPEMSRHGIEEGMIILLGNRFECDRKKGEDFNDPVVAIDHELFPHLFKKLEWWEERKPEEMPKYVRRVRDKRLFKIADVSENGRRWHNENEIEHWYFLKYAKDFLPATEEEYNTQKEPV